MAPKLNLNVAVTRVEETVRSLEEAAKQALAVEETASRLAAAEAQQAAAAEQLRATFETMAASIESTVGAVQHLTRGQTLVRDNTADAQRSMQTASGGLQEMTASVAAVRKDAELLA